MGQQHTPRRTQKTGQRLPKHVTMHGKQYKYRRQVPADLVDVIGKRFIVELLDDPADAGVLAAEHDRAFTAIRAMDPKARADVKRLGLKGAIGAADAWVTLLPRFRQDAALDIGSLDLTAPDVVDKLREIQDAKARLAALEAGIASYRPLAPTGVRSAPVVADGAAIGDLVDVWERHEKPVRATVSRRRTYVRNFLEASGLAATDRLEVVTAKHARAFRDRLEGSAPSHTNAVQQLGGLSKLYKVAVSRGLVDMNPFSGVKIGRVEGDDEDEDEPAKRAFTDVEARLVLERLDGLKLSLNNRTDPDRLEEFKMIARIVAYHGMRPSEVIQLRVEDVVTVDGVLAMCVRRAAGSIKNKWSNRDVPVHAAMVDDVQRWVACHGNGLRLFPAYYRLTDAKSAFHNRAHTFIREDCGISDERVSLYSFRHRWRVLARDVARMDGHMSRFLMGHKLGRDVHDATYAATPPPMKERKAWLDRLSPI